MSAALKVHYKGENIDFIILLNEEDQDVVLDKYNAYKKEHYSGPEEEGYKINNKDVVDLNSLISIDSIFTTTTKRGTRGELLQANKQELENEFKTKDNYQIISDIIINGDLVEENSGFNKRRYSNTNAANGLRI
ncbi:hypothetical protein ACO0SA_000397 [Hanseniaspora valbyensis]